MLKDVCQSPLTSHTSGRLSRFCPLIPLAITSTVLDSRLAGRRWQMLHRAKYRHCRLWRNSLLLLVKSNNVRNLGLFTRRASSESFFCVSLGDGFFKRGSAVAAKLSTHRGAPVNQILTRDACRILP